MHIARIPIGLGVLLLAGGPVRAQHPTVGDLGWLAGCWERTTRTGQGFEQWSPGQAGELIGSARLITSERDRQTERLRIYRRGDTLVYEAHPVDQALTVFPLRAHGPDSLVFENPAHDFPQRIVYRLVGSDSLIATVSNLSGGGRPLRFAFRRIAACPAPAPATP
jgi:hypothetical protein